MSSSYFGRTVRCIQGFVVGWPLLSGMFSYAAGVSFPPLGDHSLTWRFFALLITGSAIWLPYYFLPSRPKPRTIAYLFTLFVLLSGFYLALDQTFVVPITYPDGDVRFVTRGGTRCSTLTEPYLSMNDGELIKQAGQTDLQLEDVYTKFSLYAHRQLLFWSYVAALVTLQLFLGWIAAREGVATRPTSGKTDVVSH